MEETIVEDTKEIQDASDLEDYSENFERYQKPFAFGTVNIYFTEMHSQVLTLLAG